MSPGYLRCCHCGHLGQVCCSGDWTCLLASAACVFVCTGTLHTPYNAQHNVSLKTKQSNSHFGGLHIYLFNYLLVYSFIDA